MKQDAAHTHGHGSAGRVLLLATIATLGYAAVEAVAGWWSGSLALLGDAGHMVTDGVALILAALAARIALLPPSPRHSFGMVRVQLIAALVNAVFMLAVVGVLVVEAVNRLISPVEVRGEAVTLVAVAGLLLNLAVAWMLSRGERDLNVRAALLHVVGDLLGSVAAIVSGLLVVFTGWMRADPALTFVIAALIGFSSLRLAREALHGLMEGVPLHLSLPEVARAMVSVRRRGVGARPAYLVAVGRTGRAVGARRAGQHGAVGRGAGPPEGAAVRTLRDRAYHAPAGIRRACPAADGSPRRSIGEHQ